MKKHAWKVLFLVVLTMSGCYYYGYGPAVYYDDPYVYAPCSGYPCGYPYYYSYSDPYAYPYTPMEFRFYGSGYYYPWYSPYYYTPLPPYPVRPVPRP